MLTPSPVTDSFRWRDVPEPDRDWLRRRTEDVESLTYRTACDLIRIGTVLAEVRRRIKGKFLDWLLSQTPFSQAQSYRLMAVSKAFAEYTSQIEKVEPSALYILAQEKTPKAARNHAVLLAAQGKRVTRALAMEILDAHRPVHVNKGDMDDVDTSRRKAFKEDILQDRRLEKLEAQDADREIKLGRAVAKLLGCVSTVSVTAISEPDNPESVTYTVTTIGESGPRVVSGCDLARTLLSAAGVVELRYCPACCAPGGGIPVHLFGRDKNSPDGLMKRCSPCERARKKAMRDATASATAPATPAG